MNIFKYEMKSYIKSIVVWSLSIGALLVLMMVFYPTFSKDVEVMDKILKNYPEELLQVFGMNTQMSMASVLGYFAFSYVFVQLCLAVQASNYGFSFLSVEERELTCDFLMTKPVSRKKILISKFLAAFLALTCTNIMTVVFSYVSIEMFKDSKSYSLKNLLITLSAIVIFQLFFLSLGMLVSVSINKIRNVLSWSISFSFGLYVLNAIRSIIGGELLGYITPFYHFDAGYMLKEGKYNISMTLISAAFIIFAITYSYFRYLNRNIHSL